MAEIRADDECVLWVFEVWRKHFRNSLLLKPVIITNQNGHDRRELVWCSKRLLEAFVDVGRVHLQRVLGDVPLSGYVIKLACFFDPLDGVLVDS